MLPPSSLPARRRSSHRERQLRSSMEHLSLALPLGARALRVAACWSRTGCGSLTLLSKLQRCGLELLDGGCCSTSCASAGVRSLGVVDRRVDCARPWDPSLERERAPSLESVKAAVVVGGSEAKRKRALEPLCRPVGLLKLRRAARMRERAAFRLRYEPVDWCSHR